MILHRSAPVTPPVFTDHDRWPALVAALLFTVTPSDRALAGWYAPSEAFSQLQDLGVELVREAR